MNKKNLSHKKPYVLLFLFYLLFLTTVSANEVEDKVEKQENWRLPNLEEGDDASQSKCFLLSPKVTIDDGQGKTRIWLEMTDKSLILKTKSDIDTGFNDIGIKIDDKEFIPLDKVDNAVDVVFEKNITTITQQFITGQNVKLQLRFWPTWPSKGVQEAKFSLLGFTKAYKALPESCRMNKVKISNPENLSDSDAEDNKKSDNTVKNVPKGEK
jgi:hypothetical protein